MKPISKIQKSFRIDLDTAYGLADMADELNISQNELVNKFIDDGMDDQDLYIRRFKDFDYPEKFFESYYKKMYKNTRYVRCKYDGSLEYFLVWTYDVPTGHETVHLYHYAGYADIITRIAFARTDTIEGDNLIKVFGDLVTISYRVVDRFLNEEMQGCRGFEFTKVERGLATEEVKET